LNYNGEKQEKIEADTLMSFFYVFLYTLMCIIGNLYVVYELVNYFLTNFWFYLYKMFTVAGSIGGSIGYFIVVLFLS